LIAGWAAALESRFNFSKGFCYYCSQKTYQLAECILETFFSIETGSSIEQVALNTAQPAQTLVATVAIEAAHEKRTKTPTTSGYRWRDQTT
jgi:hypothetical protein